MDKDLNSIKIKDIDLTEFNTFSNFNNDFNTFQSLLSDSNLSKLEKFDLTEEQYNAILKNITSEYQRKLNLAKKQYLIDFSCLSTRDKILLFSKTFVKTNLNYNGDDYGYFDGNQIFLNHRAFDYDQIITLVHELSHFLLSEILTEILCLLLDTNKTKAVKATIHYLLLDDFNNVIDEYCAHKVERKLIPLGFQNLASFTAVRKELKDSSYNYRKEIIIAKKIGNGFAENIGEIIYSFIDNKLEEEIKMGFKEIPSSKRYDEGDFEIPDKFTNAEFVKSIKRLFEKLFLKEYSLEELEEHLK